MSSSTLLGKMSQTTASSLTNSSSVSSIKNLVAWYESTSSDSFLNTESSQGENLSLWRDINTQSVRKNNFAQTESDNMPIYSIESVSGLPMVYFDGIDDGFNLPDSTIPTLDNSYMAFFVIKPLSNSNFDKTLISSEASENVNFNIYQNINL